MRMAQQYTVREEQVLEAVGFISQSHSLFPRVEHKLFQNTEILEALAFIAPKSRMDGYHSVLDFLFCEVEPHFKEHCFRWYQAGRNTAIPSEALPLRERITTEEQEFFTIVLLRALDEAHRYFKEHRRISWEDFLDVVRDTAV